MIRSLASAAVLMASLAGCTYRATLIPEDGARFASVNPETVALTAAQTTEQPHTVVGLVAVNVFGDAHDALGELAFVAAEAGADLVLGVRLEQVNTRVGASGLAVRLHPGARTHPARASRQRPPPRLRQRPAQKPPAEPATGAPPAPAEAAPAAQ